MTAQNATAPIHTRESWLHAAVEEFRPTFTQIGFPLPERVHITTGFPYGVAKENETILGQCLSRSLSADGVNHVFVSPAVGDTAEVLRIVLHELIHVALDNEDGHRGRFAEAATRLGFEGSMQTTPCSMPLAMELVTMAETLGDYPHGAVDEVALRAATRRTRTPKEVGPDGTPVPPAPRGHSGPAAQVNRWVSVCCPNPAHPAPVRMSRSRLAQGAPLCGVDDQAGNPCGQRMIPKA